MPPDFSDPSTVVEARTDLLDAQVDDETVMLDPDAGVYYGVNTVGAKIWALLQEPTTIAAVRDAVSEEYGVDSDECERDLRAFLEDLAARDLIDVHTESVQ